MKLAISLGGSLLTKNMTPKTYTAYAEIFKLLKQQGHNLIIGVGGGKPARQYIQLGRQLGADNQLQDRLGILATHVNALLLIAALGADAHPHIHRRSTEIKHNLGTKILVGGGHLPGSSHDYRLALFARAQQADLIIKATDHGGVFNKDPGKHSDAKQIKDMTYKQFIKLIKTRFKQSPGNYGLFDLKAAKTTQKLGVPLIIIDGTNPEEIINAVNGTHSGTTIHL